MSDKNTRRSLLPRISGQAVSSAFAALLGLAGIALIALGVYLIFAPAGVITAGAGLVWLQMVYYSEPQT